MTRVDHVSYFASKIIFVHIQFHIINGLDAIGSHNVSVALAQVAIQNPKEIVKSFLLAPVVIAILVSILLNIFNGREWLYNFPVTGALMSTLEFLGKLTVPLILIIVGYGIKVNRAGLQDALWVVSIRLGILAPLALILNIYLIRGFLQLDGMFEAALFTLLILPPPFIIPLYARSDLNAEERQYINNVLTLHSIISVPIFVIYFVVDSIG